jgi:hypothetical protein
MPFVSRYIALETEAFSLVCGAFRWAVKFGLCGEISREKISIVTHRNIRCFSSLMVNVESRCRINFQQGQVAGAASETQ